MKGSRFLAFSMRIDLCFAAWSSAVISIIYSVKIIIYIYIYV